MTNLIISQLTVLIPTSSIPSHPSTKIIDETIEHIREYTDAEIIIMCDGLNPDFEYRAESYNQYILNLSENIEKNKYGKCRLKIFETHQHQSGMTTEVLKEIITPLIFFVEHDTHIRGNIPFREICDLIESDLEINYMRFNIFHQILTEHEYLMLNNANRYCCTTFGKPIEYVRTIQYSQRPHIAKTKWYRDILWTYFQDKRCMIEDIFHGIVIEKYKAIGYDFGLAIYTPSGDQTRSYHSNGRENDKKIIGE